MSNFGTLMLMREKSGRAWAEAEGARARYDLAKINERCAYLISQHDPVAQMGLDRDKLRLVLAYLRHGELPRLIRELDAL